jgi:hypothetical protein
MAIETLSRLAVGAFSFARPLLVSRAAAENYLHSKFPRQNGIDIALDDHMWVEWKSAFQIEGRLVVSSTGAK